MRLVLINGEPRTPDEATISVYDRGFLYGDSVFETVRTYGGRPFALGEHLARLGRSAERVFIELPVPVESLAREVDRALELAQNAESSARIMISRGVGPLGLDPDSAQRPTRVIFIEPLVLPPREAYRDGIVAHLVQTVRTTDATAAAGAKVGNYLTSLLAVREAKRAGASEALIVDGRGRIVEGATSNVFIVRGGTLRTPAEEAGILPGITRAHLLDAASRSRVPIELGELTPDDLFGADEAFISSSIREVLPVVRVGDRTIGSGKPGAITRKLHTELRAHAGATGPLPWE